MGLGALVPVIILLLMLLKLSVFILKQYEEGVVFFFGQLEKDTRKAGLRIVIPVIEQLVRVDTRTVTMDIPPQDVITKDNVSLKVNAVLYFRVVKPTDAITKVENYLYATSQIAQTTLRSVCGEAELDDLLSKREQLNLRIQNIIDHQTEPWGIKVATVEIKDIDLPQEMKRAMAKQAEAERERRAKIIQAEGEYGAAEKLKDAANIMSQNSVTLQLRYLETLRNIASEHNSTILFPMPIDIMEVFKRKLPQ